MYYRNRKTHKKYAAFKPNPGCDFCDPQTHAREILMDIIADYEQQHYDVYARSPGSKTRSVPHQHTHLIKTDHQPSKGMLFLRKPYILWRIG